MTTRAIYVSPEERNALIKLSCSNRWRLLKRRYLAALLAISAIRICLVFLIQLSAYLFHGCLAVMSFLNSIFV
ncbi:hypothetical protein RB195_002979 [Necator americanus]|uniref:Uncharacterized protein n=1 Tax=Necator americanus TaxID=51031 RepID=A0ABR1DLX2_NECAM